MDADESPPNPAGVFRKRAAVAVALVVVLTVSVALWEFVIRDALAPPGHELYGIDVILNGTPVGRLTLNDLEALDPVEFEDVQGSGRTESGPLVADAVLLVVDASSLEPDTPVTIGSTITGEERRLTWGELSNETRMYILDFTNRGTVKFTSPDTAKNERVRDVTDIRLGE